MIHCICKFGDDIAGVYIVFMLGLGCNALRPRWGRVALIRGTFEDFTAPYKYARATVCISPAISKKKGNYVCRSRGRASIFLRILGFELLLSVDIFMMPAVNNWFMRFLENYIYALPEPPPRKRVKPMGVLCVGMPRTGTESLQHALLRLSSNHIYHG